MSATPGDAAADRAGRAAVPASPSAAEPTERFLRACRGLPVDATPVWFMRQAGRYMAEYREIRKHHTLLEICAQPELAAEVTLQPVRALGVDAAILFADILLPLEPMGIELEFAKGEGPVIHNPVRTAGDVAALRHFEPRESLAHVLDAIRILRRELPAGVPLIGFAGAPFTLASYLVHGGSKGGLAREAVDARRFMYERPALWHELMAKVAGVVADYLVAQVEAGAQAVQLFDSWIGALGPDDYREYVAPHSAAILHAAAATGVPVIHFGTGTATLLGEMKAAGGDVIGLDWRTPLDWGRKTLGEAVPVQGNLDPVALFAPRAELDRRIRRIVEQNAGRPGHVFNLGHGILQGTPVENVRHVVEQVHELSRT